jgi:hypothetical protein
MSTPIVPPSAPSFVTETIAMLGARFDNLSALDQERVMGVGRISELARVPGQSPREAFVAAMLDTTLRSAAVAASYYARPIGPAHESVGVCVGETVSGRRIVALRVLDAEGTVRWYSAEENRQSGTFYRWTLYPSRAKAADGARAILRVAVKRAVAP